MAGATRRDRQVVRILGILGTLLEGGRPSVQDLAARFNTRRETIYRDFKALEDAGYPLAGDEHGRLSHPRLMERARKATPAIRLNEQELEALLWAVGQQSPVTQPFTSDLASASVKLRAMVAAHGESWEPAIQEAVSTLQRGARDYSSHRPTVLSLVEGILQHHRCRVSYRSPWRQEAHEFEYDPYRLLAIQDGLYCIGQTPAHGGLTTLAIDRISSIAVSEISFTVDPAYDSERITRDAFGIVWDDPMAVVIRFRADQAPYVRERVWHPTQTIRDLENRGLELQFQAGGKFEIARWVLGWGDAAEVIEPAELREYVRNVLQAAARQYA